MPLLHKTLLLVVTFLFIGRINAQYCTNTARYSDAQYFDSTQLTVGSNIQYGTALDYQGNAYPLRMDLYYPNLNVDTSAKRPFVLLFHGGGFSSGDKQSGDIRDLCILLALRGFVCASVNYRIGHDFSEYGQYKARYRAIQDGHAAMRYIVNNANTIRIDTSWLFVGGQSAGSLLALGMVYADQDELDSVSLLYNSTSTSVELGNLLTSGNSLTNTYSIKGIFNNWGGIVKSEVDAEEMIPTIAFHGGLDIEVVIGSDNSFLHYTLNGSAAIHTDLLSKGVCSDLTVDTTGGHGIYRNASSVFRVQRASCFFRSIFCNTCTSFYSTDSVPANCSLMSGVSDYHLASAITIYPNPFDQFIHIDGLSAVADVELYDSFGKLVFREEKNNGTINVDLLPGVYFLRLKQSTQTITKKLVKY